MPEPKQYIIQVPGEEQAAYWDEAKFKRNQDQLYKDHQDAQVTELSPANLDAIDDAGSYWVGIPNDPNVAQWDGAKLKRNREQLLKDHPDAQIYSTSHQDYGTYAEGRRSAAQAELDKVNRSIADAKGKASSSKYSTSDPALAYAQENYQQVLETGNDMYGNPASPEMIQAAYQQYKAEQAYANAPGTADLERRKAELEKQIAGYDEGISAYQSAREKANRTPEANELIDIYTRIGELQRELDGLPPEQDYRGLSREEAVQYAQAANSPEGRRRSEIRKELDQLREAKWNNPAYQAYLEAQKEDIRGMMSAMEEGMKKNAPGPERSANMSEQEALDIASGAEERPGDQQEQDYYSTARRYYGDALKAAEAPSKYDDGFAIGLANFGKGVGRNIMSAVSILELANALQDVNVINTVKEIQKAEGKDVDLQELINEHPDRLSYLSEGQREMMKAFIKRCEIEQLRSDDTSIMYNAGAGAIQSVGFMADFLATGGVGTAAGKATAKALAKTTTEEIAGRTLGAQAKKMLVGNLEAVTKALVMTPMMPSSYANFITNLTQLNEYGQMDLSTQAVLKSVGDVFIETFSENAGELFGIPFDGKYFDFITNNKLGEIGKAMSRTGAGRLMREAGWHGIVGEMAEEVLGNAMRSIPGIGTDPDALKNFFSKDEFLTTLASFAPMSIIGAGSSAIQVRRASKNMSKRGEELTDILTGLGIDEETIGQLLDVSKKDSVEDLGAAITAIGQRAIATGQVTEENVEDLGLALGHYAIAASQYKVLQGVLEGEADIARVQNASAIEGRVGDNRWYHEGEDGNYVRSITLEDGSEWFVVPTTDGDEDQIVAVGDNGQIHFFQTSLLEGGVEEGLIKDSGEMRLYDYLDGINEEQVKAAEQERMLRESEEQLAVLKQQIAENPTLNVGTEEAPVNASVIASNDYGVRAVWVDAQGTQIQKDFTWAEVADFLGSPIDVKTDEQIEEEEVQAEEDIRSRKEDYNKTIPVGTEFTAFQVEGEEPVTYKFQRAFINEDGTMMLQVTDKETGKDGQITEEMALQGNLTSVLDSFKTPAEVQQEEAVAEEETPVDDGVLRDFRGNPIPLREDGTVNQTAFWNADPEAWARWNDSVRQDGGVNSRGYIAKAISKLQAEAAAVQQQMANELDFDRIDQLEGQLGQINSRIADLERIENNYANAEVAQAEAMQTPSETSAPVAETTEAAPVAESTQTQEDAEAARVQALKDRVRAWVERTGVEADALESIDQVQNKQAAKAIAEGQPVAGWFEPSTGKVVIYLPNIMDEAEIDRTYMHEVISHKGLRDLLGNEGWNTLMDSVWDNLMTDKDRADYLKYNSHLKGSEEFLRRAAADEYVAHLAETVDPENAGAWQKFVEMVKEILLKLGMNVKLTTEDLSNLLQASLANYERMQAETRAAAIATQEAGEGEQVTPQSELTKEITANLGGQIEGEGGNQPTLFSIKAIAEGVGFQANEGNESGDVTFTTSDGRVFDGHHPLTVEDVKGEKNSVMNYMMEDARRFGTITPEQEENIWQKYTDVLNRMLEKGLEENGGYENLSSQWQWVGETVFKTVSTNSDAQYSYSLDITRVCKKNEAVINSISAMQRRVGYGITPGQIMDIYLSSIEEGYQVPCPVCYVFSRYIDNGKYATFAINGQKKYGSRLKDPSTLSKEEKQKEIDYWVSELKKQEEWNKDKENAKKISRAKSVIKHSYTQIDRLGRLILEGKLSEAEKQAALKEIEKLDKRYKAALNVVSQSSLDLWIKSFAIHKVKGKWELYKDSYQGFPEEYALDLRLTAETIRKYPAIQRLRKSGGSAAGKEIHFAANNDIGDVTMMLGASNLKTAQNYYKTAVEAKTEKERAAALKDATERFRGAMVYAQMQSLRGGQRMWSWSDNIERLAPDVFVNLMQLQMLGGALQSYSKQLEGANLVATMGGYVNGSLMAYGIGYQAVDADAIDVVDGKEVLKNDITDTVTEKTAEGDRQRTRFLAKAGSPVFTDKDGKKVVLLFDDVVGIDAYGRDVDGVHMKGLFDLNATLDKAGNILVGMDDTHIRAAMADDRVFFIIPWHASGQSVHILTQMLGYLGVDIRKFNPKDYTNVQEEKSAVGEDGKIIPNLVEFWEAHNYEADYKCGIEGGIPSGKNGELSKEQKEYRALRDAIFTDPNLVNDKARMRKIKADEFLSQVWRKVHDTVSTGQMTKGDTKFIYPYEYWDEDSTYENADVNGKRYLEYCRRMGVKPKFIGKLDGNPEKDFGNFADDKGFWKLLIDRRMYAVDGSFQDLTPVSTEEFTPDLIDPEQTEREFVVTKVADAEGVERIAERAIQKEQERPGGLASVNYDMTLEQAIKEQDKVTEPKLTKAQRKKLTQAQQNVLNYLETGEFKSENEAGANDNVQFRKVEPIVDEKNEELFEQAKKTFGTTNNLAEAGYVIPDGSMLDFSGRHLLDPGQDSSWMNGMRQVDHREISDLNYEKDGNTPSGYETDMRDFIRRGAIRLNSGVINLATKPTKGQENVLWGLIQRANGDVDVDFGDGYDSDHYASYNHARPERILNDIRRYFDEGIEPEGNVMFRKGRITPAQDKEYMEAVQAGDMDKAQQMVREAAALAMPDTKVVDEDGKPLIVYHGTKWGGFNDFERPGSDNVTGLIWTTPDYAYANIYSDDTYFTDEERADFTPKVYSLLVNAKNPLDLGDIQEVIGSDNFRRIAETLGYTPESLLQELEGIPYEGVWKQWQIYEVTRYGKFANLLREKGYDSVHALEVSGDALVDTYGVVEPGQVKSADPVTYDDNGEVIPLSERFNEDNEDIRFRKANQTQNGFISNAEAALDKIKMDKATPEQWVKMLEKEGGLKAGEDKWLGLSDWLKASDKKTLTKDEVSDFIEQNRIQIEEVHYSENGHMSDEELDDIYNYGLPPELDDFHSKLQDEFDSLLEEMSAEEAYETMAEKYGGLFRDAYDKDETVDNESLQWMYIDSLMELAGFKNPGQANNDHAINSTRLTLTTEGLEHKREIALTVPTVEPYYGSLPDVHFADAYTQGRAIAWIRFGDTTTNPNNDVYSRRIMDYLEQTYGNPTAFEKMTDRDVALYEFANFIYRGQRGFDIDRMGYIKGSIVRNVGEERADKVYPIFEKMVKDNGEGQRVLVIDEIQSQRHQDAREKGGYSDKNSIIVKRENKGWSYSYPDSNDSGFVSDLIAPTEEEARNHAAKLHRGAVPAAPFEKNWHELAMKRMLRLAAEEGYDKIAWTTGGQQADRYDIGGVVDSISYHGEDNGLKLIDINLKTGRGGIIHLGVDQDEVVKETYNGDGTTQSGSEYSGHSLSDIIGKENADKVMAIDEVGGEISGEGLKVGGEGMKGFYDDILPRFMNKYGKKWGVKVQDIVLPNIGKDAAAGIADGITMHSIDVTPEMRESVMEGQVMFRKTAPNGKPSNLTDDQWEQVRTPEFKAWFGDWENDPENASKVVDENGEPRVVYHGSKWNPLKEEPGKAVFDENRVGENFDWVDIDWNFFFTASEASAKGYGRAIPVFLNIRNMEVHTIRESISYEMDEETGHEIVVTAHDAGSENDEVTKVDNPDGVMYTIRAVDVKESERRLAEAIKQWEGEHRQELEDEYNSLKEQSKDLIKQIKDEYRRLYDELGFQSVLEMGYEEMSERAGYVVDQVVKDAAKLRGGVSTEKLDELEKQFNDVDQKMFKISQRQGIEGRPTYEEYEQYEVEKDYKTTDIFAVDRPNQIKSAVANNGNFSPDNDDIRFSLRGIIGAENAEDEVALDNLEVAEEMEKAGKDSQTIWKATGWERGVDGKWRNEIPDAKQKEGVSLQKHNIAGEILDAPELFSSYPELTEIPIDLVSGAVAGAYNRAEKRITIDTDYNTTYVMSDEDRKKVGDRTMDFILNGSWKSERDVTKYKQRLSEQYGRLVLSQEGIKTVLHELQHAIQAIEGFARGMNKQLGARLYYRESLKTNPEETYFAWFLSRKNSPRKLNQAGREKVIRYSENYDKSNLTDQDRAYFAKLINYLKGISDSEFKNFVSRAAKVVKTAEKAGEESYEKSAGEVESRNVERRSRLSDEDRKKYSPEITEDYSRSEQGVRFRKRTKEDPKETIKVYKLMRLEDGKKLPLFIDRNSEPLEDGQWYDADSPDLAFLKEMPSGIFLVDADNGTYTSLKDYQKERGAKATKWPTIEDVNEASSKGLRWMKITDTEKGQKRYEGENRKYENIGINGSDGVSTFAMRPGWHAGSLPTMRQIGKGAEKNIRDDNFVWVEGEIPADIDYNEEAQRNPDKDIPTHIPTDGFYMKATNADKAKSQADRVGWYVAGAFKPNRVIGDLEARQIIDDWNAEHPDAKVEYDWPREGGRIFNADTMQLEEAPALFRKASQDKYGNPIGDGSWHSKATINQEVVDKYPVTARVVNSLTTESSYVYYINQENGESVKVRFSDHSSNAEKYREVLPSTASADEILYRLGLKSRTFVPDPGSAKLILNRRVSKKDIAAGKYEEADKTIKELYDLPVGTDISEYTGKLAKGSNLLIQGDAVEANPFAGGHYEYSDIEPSEYANDGVLFRLNQDAVQQSREGGLTGVIGDENAAELYRNVYKAVPKEIRHQIVDKAGDSYLFSEATKDMISEAVEKGDKTGIAGLAANMLRDYAGPLDERTARYILWRGDRKVADDDLLDTVNDIAMQRRLKVGQFAEQPMFRRSPITPEQDREYLDAVESGDMEKARQMVREAAALAMPNTKVVDEDGKPKIVFHGTHVFNVDNTPIVTKNGMPFTVFYEDSHFGNRQQATEMQELREGDEASTRRIYAEMGRPDFAEGVSHIYPVFLNIERMARTEDQNENWDEELKAWRDAGYDGAVYANEHESEGDSYIAFYPNQIKSAEPVTYDENGEVIPLSERFNPESDDIRFRLADNLEENQNRANSMADDAKATLDEKKAEARKDDALTTIKAMSLQKEYDRKTVNTLTVLAKNILKDQSVETLSRHEIARLLGIVTTSIGKAPKTVKKNADALMGMIIDHLLKSEETKLGMLVRIRAEKTNQTGVQVAAKLDPRGQKILKFYKEGLEMPLTNPEDRDDITTIGGRLIELTEKMESKDATERAEGEEEYAGLMLAKEYLENIRDSRNEVRELRRSMADAAAERKAGKMSKTAYDELVEENEKGIRQKKIERVEAYRALYDKMEQMIAGSIEALRDFKEDEKARVDEIHHIANKDMEGRDATENPQTTVMGRLANSSLVRFFTQPLATFEQMLRLFGEKSVTGEGFLFNFFHRGWVDAQEKAYLGEKEAKSELDAKVSEVFDEKMRWSDLYAEERKMPNVKVKWWDAGRKEMVEHELSQGQLLYIYMVNKMTDGRMKLRRMGITQEHVDAIRKQMDFRFLELADWLQEEYLVKRRNKYDAVHVRLFGAHMAAIEDYFPLKINKNAIDKEVNIGVPDLDGALPASTTGAIIKRRMNTRSLDLLNADAFSVVIEHIEQMERWAAFAEYNKNLSTLLSYKRFRNQLRSMTSVYGSGEELLKNFEATCEIVGGTYRPAGKKSGLDRDALSISKGLTAAKISFRVYTAMKQLLSMPAFLADANVKYLGQNLATPWKAWKWAMENLPLFEKRWKSRQAGDTRLMQNESDWKVFRTQMYDTLSRLGMSPNAFVDAMTVSIGAHSIYQTRYDRYIKDGYTEEQADRKAKQDATTLYNETQQSSEAAFISKVQLDRTWAAAALTVFRNSSMGYQRQLHDAIRNLGKMTKTGYKTASIEFMKRQMVEEGLTEEQAQSAAERNYDREVWRSFARIGTFGFLVQFAWNLGPYLAYLLVGGDDDKKEEMLKDAAIHAMAGSVEGLAGGNVMSEIFNKVMKGESLNNYEPSLMPIVSDVKNTYKRMNSNPVAAWYDLVCIGIQSGLGVNPQTFSDAIVAVVDACDGDLETSKEAMLLFLRIIQTPQSQLDQIYIDELGLNGKQARSMSMSEMAERYARYKMNKEAGPFVGFHSEESEKKRRDTYNKRFKQLVKERKEINKPKDKK